MTTTTTDPATLTELCRLKARLTEARNLLNAWTPASGDQDAAELVAEAANHAGDATCSLSRLIDHLAD